jgi:hypothetical protein
VLSGALIPSLALEGRGFRSARDTERAAQAVLAELRHPFSGQWFTTS